MSMETPVPVDADATRAGAAIDVVPGTAGGAAMTLDARPAWRKPRLRWLRRHPTLVVGLLLLAMVAAIALAAPVLATHDPTDLDPLARLQPPSE